MGTMLFLCVTTFTFSLTQEWIHTDKSILASLVTLNSFTESFADAMEANKKNYYCITACVYIATEIY